MSNAFGMLFRVSVFGESHSAAVGVVIDGIPAGMELDMEKVGEAMARRAAGKTVGSTARREPDVPEILSGFYSGKTTGTPLAAIIRNADIRSGDYDAFAGMMRPGHADYTGFIKYGGANDPRGGGHFSGRLTAPLVFAGAVADQLLALRGVYVGAHIGGIAGIADDGFERFDREYFKTLQGKVFCVVNDDAGNKMRQAVADAAAREDSVGGTVECAVCGLPAGLGEPFFDSVESEVSHIMFSIPAIKAVEFGAGFAFAEMTGSKANDTPVMERGGMMLETNHSGGVNGGITNGMPVVFRVAVRPTPSIGAAQKTVDIRTLEEKEIRIGGRHDACIVPRAVEAVRAGTAIAFADLLLRSGIK